MTPLTQGSNIKISDLLVGEYDAMNAVAAAWAMLFKIDQKYLASFIARLEKDESEMTKISMPIFKMVAAFANVLQDHTKKDSKLMDALKEASMRENMREFFGGHH
jgi:hypothetical protein